MRDAGGGQIGWGSGFLISPDLVLTNHHVLEDADTAGSSRLQMPGEDDIDGNPLPVQVFDLDPKRFFITSPIDKLDYTIVAVKPRADGTTVASFGFNRLIGATGKLVKGEYVSIIQFPNGGQKQIALRQNQVVDIFTNFVHYETDTSPGSCRGAGDERPVGGRRAPSLGRAGDEERQVGEHRRRHLEGGRGRGAGPLDRQ